MKHRAKLAEEACIGSHRTLTVNDGVCAECDLLEALEKLRAVIPADAMTGQIRWHLKNIEHKAAALIIFRNAHEDIRVGELLELLEPGAEYEHEHEH